MKQAVHIFRKDVRHLWPAILVVIAQTALFAYAGAVSPGAIDQRPDPYPTFTSLTLPLGWWYLIAALIHQEALTGHQQYWVTRPYSWKSLIAAKALFVVTFINVPKLLADFVILQGQGFRAVSYWSGFIASQVMLTAVWLLPYAALAAITVNLRQFFLAVLIVWMLVLLPSFFWTTPGFLFYGGEWILADWIEKLVIIGLVLMASLAILLWQYSRRRTKLSRLIAVSAMVLILGIPHLISMHQLMAVQMRLSKPRIDVSPIQIELDPTRKEPVGKRTGRRVGYEGTIAIAIPLQITELPVGMRFTSDALTVEFAEPDGKVSQARGAIEQENDGVWERLFVQPDVFQRLKNQQLTTRHSVYMSLLGDRSTIQLDIEGRRTVVPDLGICRCMGDGSAYTVRCYRPFRTPSVFARASAFDLSRSFGLETASYSPFPAEDGISPLVVSARESGSSTAKRIPEAVTKSVLAHIHQDFEIRGLRLEDYALPY